MKYTFVTSLNKHYWELGSNINIQSWDENFPEDVEIHIFDEDGIPDKDKFSKRIIWHNLFEECPELVEFKEKYKDNKHFNGQADVSENKRFKWNAIKFAHKTFPLFNIARNTTSGALVWLDSDVLSIDKFDHVFLETVCPKSKIVSYLGRPSVYSECGWVYYNLDHQLGREFLNRFEHAYMSGDLENYAETHDSFVFDEIRLNFGHPELFHNLNANAKSNKHPFHQSLLRQKLIHNKGHNKTRKQDKFLKRYHLVSKYKG